MTELYHTALKLAKSNGYYDMTYTLATIKERSAIAKIIPDFADNKRQLANAKRRAKRQFTKMGMNKSDISRLVADLSFVPKAELPPPF
jgi:hypothetical protein